MPEAVNWIGEDGLHWLVGVITGIVGNGCTVMVTAGPAILQLRPEPVSVIYPFITMLPVNVVGTEGDIAEQGGMGGENNGLLQEEVVKEPAMPGLVEE